MFNVLFDPLIQYIQTNGGYVYHHRLMMLMEYVAFGKEVHKDQFSMKLVKSACSSSCLLQIKIAPYYDYSSFIDLCHFEHNNDYHTNLFINSCYNILIDAITAYKLLMV